MAEKLNLSLSEIIISSKKSNENNSNLREYKNKYNELKSELPRNFDKYKNNRNYKNYSRGIENRRWERYEKKNDENKHRENDTLTYRLLKISNLNIKVTNEDLRVI
jgi:hypothetical protein